MRSNGVSEFPDPSASGKLTIDAVANGSSLDTSTPAFKQAISACKSLEPAGFTGGKRSSQQQQAALKFAQCIRANGVQDFPDPANGGPSSTRIESHPPQQAGGMSILHAAMQKCRGLGSRSGGPRGEAEDLGAGRSGRPGCRSRRRRRGRHVRRAAQALGRQQPPVNTAKVERGALGDGLPGRDPDLSGAIGRLAVLRDQPGPRDIHQAARGRPGDLSGSRALPGERRPVVLLHGSTPAYRTLSAGASGPDVAELNADLVALGYATRLSSAQLPPPSGRPPPRP